MDSGMIGKIEKARRYAEEPERVELQSLRASFRGDHDTYTVSFADGRWSCNCHFFSSRGVCSHTMALERLLGPMLPVGKGAEKLEAHRTVR